MMQIQGDQEFLTIPEACEYVGGVTRQTLRLRAKANGIVAYKRGISKNVYYRKSDLDQLIAFRPVTSDEIDKA